MATTLSTRGLNLPAHDTVEPAGHNADGNPATITYKLDGSTVATLTFTYDASGNCTSIARS
jgi:YD repeat-containing protein